MRSVPVLPIVIYAFYRAIEYWMFKHAQGVTNPAVARGAGGPQLRRYSLALITMSRRPSDTGPTMTPRQALRFIARHGVVLEAARGPVPSLLEAALGHRPRRPRGSWWADPRGHEFFLLTRAVRESRDVLVCRLVQRKVTYVHRRLWPALARVQRLVGRAALQAVQEIHTASGAHRVKLTPFRARVPRRVLAAGAKLTEERALAALGSWIARERASARARQRAARV